MQLQIALKVIDNLKYLLTLLSIVQRVLSKPYDRVTKVIQSTLMLEVNLRNIFGAEDSAWWCQVEYTILDDSTIHTVQGEPVRFSYQTKKREYKLKKALLTYVY